MSPLDAYRGVTVRAYGHSFLAWPDRWSYLNRLAHELDWAVTNGAFGGDRAIDMAARVIGAGAPQRWTPAAAHLVVVDAATNDMFACGLAGIPSYRNAMRAALAYMSCEGPMDSQDITYSTGPGHAWSTESYGDYHNGSAKLGGTRVTAPGFGRPGKWAFGHLGISGAGARYTVAADGVVLGALDCQSAHIPSPRLMFGSTATRSRGHCATIVTSETPVTTWTLDRTRDAGGPWLDWYGKLNEVSPPLVVLPAPVTSRPETYAGSACTDEVVAAYGEALRDVAAEVGPHCQVVDTMTNWDPQVHMRRTDGQHPNAMGHAHIAAAIRDHLAGLLWWPATD